jgi:hypothetical protein
MPRKIHGLEPTTTIRIRQPALRRLRILLAEEGLVRGKRVQIVDWIEEMITQGEARISVRKEARKLLDETLVR